MQLDWSTLALEILNFLVLVWLLKRFLYKPILNVVAARQAAIEQAANRTREAEAKACELQTQYEARLQNWEQERAEAHGKLVEELQAERQRALAALTESLEQERQKSKVLEERRQAEAAARSEQQALSQATAFLRRLLAGLAGPELEAKLVQFAIDELPCLAEQRKAELREALSGAREPATVSSAYPLLPGQREALSEALEQLLGGAQQCQFREDRALVAGLRINAGPWVLHANLGEELSLFSDAARDDH